MERAAAFRRLHGDGFVMPNAWDAGSAIVLANAGFAAIATTSAGIAFSLGRPDHGIPQGATAVSRAEMFDRIRQITAAVDVPVNGDLEAGLGATTLTVEALRSAGVARISLGGSIARAALGFVRESARELRDSGTITFAFGQIPQGELNALFAGRESEARARVSAAAGAALPR